MLLKVILILSLLCVGTSFFSQTKSARYQSLFSLEDNFGSHGKNFKYMPIVKGKKTEYFPRIVPIAGVYPDITAEQLLAPYSDPPVAPGVIKYDFSDPSGPQLGTIAIPGSEIIGAAEDPVALITTNEALSISSASPDPVEMVVVVDRGDLTFQRDRFYIFDRQHEGLIIGSCDQIPSNSQIVGRLIVCLMPFVKSTAAKATGFLEEDEEEDE